ncbi:hypothetical protein J6590_057627 [Homalodisca vitripennis]|nr:hypothetical protein J6590_057627 [Homalodisca vitripennis]
MDQIRQCMDNKEPSRVKFRRAEPDPPLLAVRLGSARLEYQFASVWRITDRTRAPTTEKSVHSVFTTVGQTLRTTRSAKAATFFEKTHVCNWASKIRRCMVNNQRVRLASQTRRCMGPLPINSYLQRKAKQCGLLESYRRLTGLWAQGGRLFPTLAQGSRWILFLLSPILLAHYSG